MQKPNFNLAPAENILEPGSPLPGRWVALDSNPLHRRWEGVERWTTRHGPAECTWLKGSPVSARNVLLPDGSSRGFAQFTIFGPISGWRRPEREDAASIEGWILGTVELTDADAVFADDPVQPVIEPPVDWGYPDLECDLWRFSEAQDGCQNQGFAMALYQALVNQVWRYRSGGVWMCSTRSAGSVVAEVRGRGENYHDYFWRGMPELAIGYEADVEAMLAGIGWHPMPLKQYDANESISARLLTEWEARPAAARPDWYANDRIPQNVVASGRIGRLINRVHHLTAVGKITSTEWDAVFALLNGGG